MSVEIGTQLQSDDRPLDENYLNALVQEFGKDCESPKSYAEKVALSLSQKDSRYKFLVLVTEISSSSQEIDANFRIKSCAAAVWDSEKDGSITVEIPGLLPRVLTVFWVYAN